MLAILLLAATVNASPTRVLNVTRFHMHAGDNPAWSSPTFDHSSWTSLAFEDTPHPNDTVWLRARVDTTSLLRRPGQPLGVFFGALASHELWWDGVRIGGSGVVGRTQAAEQPGPIETYYQVPDRLAAPGLHTIAVRASAFHRGFVPHHGYWNLLIADYDLLPSMLTRSAHLASIALSGILLTGVFAFAMYWLARRDRSFLLLGTLCLAAAALLVAEAWRSLFGYTYDWHIVRLRCIVALSWLVGVQLVALLVTRFPHRYGRAVLAATALLAAALPFFFDSWDPKSLFIFVVCCTVAAVWALFAAWRRMHGSTLALLGTGAVALALFVRPYAWVDNLLYFALNVLFVCLLCSHALEVRREQQEKARLRLEILRRHMQPHFVMNTLTALSEWIEQEPKTAVRMIESLSDELRILGEMSTKTVVTADEELRLCRSHVANMSLRRDIAYVLEVDGIDGTRMVPPAVFHTLVENAITHSDAPAQVTMRLSAHVAGGRMRYVFESPYASDEPRDVRPGSGTRYIEARLREAWGDGWTFRQGRIGDLWRAEIEVTA